MHNIDAVILTSETVGSLGCYTEARRGQKDFLSSPHRGRNRETSFDLMTLLQLCSLGYAQLLTSIQVPQPPKWNPQIPNYRLIWQLQNKHQSTIKNTQQPHVYVFFQELLAYGVMGIVTPFFGCFTPSGSLSRSMVLAESGAATMVSNKK